jgi:hypothetical protein
MANCPSCGTEIDTQFLEEGALCLSCGAELPARTPAAPPAGAARVKSSAKPSRPTIAAAPRAMRKREAEAEAVRCPGCGAPSTAARCPGCGTLLKRDES